MKHLYMLQNTEQIKFWNINGKLFAKHFTQLRKKSTFANRS
jgi:hypothetical protein